MSPVMKSLLIVLGIAGAVLAQNSTTQRTPGWFFNLASQPVRGGAQAINGLLGLGQSGVNFGTSAASRVTQGVTGAKISLANMGIGLLSDGLRFSTGVAGQFATIGSSLAATVPIPGVAALASLGANMINMGANMTNLGGQLALSTVQTVENAKANIANSAVQMGTGIASGIANAGFNMASSGVNMAANATESVIDAADRMIATGTAMMENGIQMVNSAVTSAGSAMGEMAIQANANINAGISSASGAARNAVQNQSG